MPELIDPMTREKLEREIRTILLRNGCKAERVDALAFELVEKITEDEELIARLFMLAKRRWETN